jgi:hypothetical protein
MSPTQYRLIIIKLIINLSKLWVQSKITLDSLFWVFYCKEVYKTKHQSQIYITVLAWYIGHKRNQFKISKKHPKPYSIDHIGTRIDSNPLTYFQIRFENSSATLQVFYVISFHCYK